MLYVNYILVQLEKKNLSEEGETQCSTAFI